MKTPFLITIGAAVLGIFVQPAIAQVPGLLSYQGKVAVGNVNFTGNGKFKFALVNGNGSTSYWSNDGSSVAGSQPTGAVTLPVTSGLITVHLGDTSLANMTTIPSSVFNNSDVRLRVWFDDNVHGSQLQTPDKRIAAVGYAMIAGSVQDGAVTSAKIANGAVGASQLAAGAAAANLNTSGQSTVPSGGMILSSNVNDTNLANAGYLKIGKVVVADTWQRLATDAPSPRSTHSAVWTGTDMIVWGGSSNDGGRYNPRSNSWVSLPTLGAPSLRSNHSAVWTGSVMIVWGGWSGSAPLSDGGRYNPTTNSWSAISTSGAPSARAYHNAIWTGSEMLVWGGSASATPGINILGDGWRYNPVSDSWSAMNTANAPSPRLYHTSIWTGSEMVVWGGYGAGANHLNDGGRYRPASNSWIGVAISGAPSIRYQHSAVWTGTEMIIWGGSNLSDGGRYNPSTDTWTPVAVNTTFEPTSRKQHSAVWTGNVMIIYGGFRSSSPLNDGAIYDPVSNSWNTMETISAPLARYNHSAVWTGNEMLVYGGRGATVNWGDTYGYNLGRIVFLYQRP